ncbi:MAG: hypothetical protein C4562_07360 [Actinobacteria bacterium]|nr:MAG: hypothetical protein C4562_07360 [Actinomycetota bacterium]
MIFSKKRSLLLVNLLVIFIITPNVKTMAVGPANIAVIENQSPQYKNLVDQLIKLKSRSGTVSQMMDKLDDRLNDVDNRMRTLQSKMAETEFELNEKSETLNDRVRAIYINETSDSPLEVVLKSDNLNEFIDRLSFFEWLLKNDTFLVKKIKYDRSALINWKNELVESRQKIVRLKNEKESSLKEISALKDELKRRIAAASSQQILEVDQWVGVVNRINQFLSGYGSPLDSYGQVFVAAGRRYQVDPRLIVAICGVESTFGQYCITPFNGWGRKAVGGGYKMYGSWDEAIWDQALYLRTRYLDLGLTSFYQIGQKYCPPDPAWPDKVKAFFMMI